MVSTEQREVVRNYLEGQCNLQKQMVDVEPKKTN